MPKEIICDICGKAYERKGHHKCKRGVDDIADYLELRQIINLVIDAKIFHSWLPELEIRDRALLAALALTGMRISELLSIEKARVNVSKSEVWIKDVRILKRRGKPIYKDFYMPREGVLGPLTEIFLRQVNRVKKGPVFDIGRCQAWRIINNATGKWCHYFRSQRISYLVNKFRSTVIVGDMQGIKKSDTIDHYFKGGQKHFTEELTPR